MDEDFYNVETLPPRPEPDSGEPRPPRARRLTTQPTRRSGSLEDLPMRLQSPPEGEGAVLEWHQHDYRCDVGLAVVLIPLYAVVLGGLIAVNPGWPWWLMLLLAPFLGWELYATRGLHCSAGAEWLQTPKGWVRLYELRAVKYTFRGVNDALRLEDAGGRTVELPTADVLGNQRLWDLVYNGIRHSTVLGGATTNAMARKALEIPPATSYR
ncbi:hypothetical protein [Bounagaea algeriensis]